MEDYDLELNKEVAFDLICIQQVPSGLGSAPPKARPKQAIQRLRSEEASTLHANGLEGSERDTQSQDGDRERTTLKTEVGIGEPLKLLHSHPKASKLS